MDTSVHEYKSPFLSCFPALGLLAIIGRLGEYWILLLCILQHIRCTPPHTGKSSPSLAVVELAHQTFPTLNFSVPIFWHKHRTCLEITEELKVSELTCLHCVCGARQKHKTKEQRSSVELQWHCCHTDAPI